MARRTARLTVRRRGSTRGRSLSAGWSLSTMPRASVGVIAKPERKPPAKKVARLALSALRGGNVQRAAELLESLAPETRSGRRRVSLWPPARVLHPTGCHSSQELHDDER